MQVSPVFLFRISICYRCELQLKIYVDNNVLCSQAPPTTNNISIKYPSSVKDVDQQKFVKAFSQFLKKWVIEFCISFV